MEPGQLRETFLVPGLFVPGELRIAVTDMDRLVLGGVMPQEKVTLPVCREFGTRYFTERRELGVVNLGDPGHVWVGSERYCLGAEDFLYIGAGNEHVVFEGRGCFYFLSCPAHRELPTVRIAKSEAEAECLGDAASASRRRLRRCIHRNGAASCQLVMGLTELEAGSVWNTVPPHTHARRSEVYLYSGLGEGVVVHLMGEPGATRHLIVRDREAVLSPPWSIHCGAGTGPYSFIWGMAGENQSFADMDQVNLQQLR